MEELKRIFGEVEIVQWGSYVKNAEHVVQLMREYSADDLVAVLPLWIIYHLVERYRVKPIHAVMEPAKNGEPYDYEDPNTGVRYRFIGFARIASVEVRFEPLTPR